MVSRTTSLALLILLALSGTGGLLIAAPAFGQTLSVSVSSPTSGATFGRGEVVAITATVTDGGSLVSGATVTANSPTGATLALEPTVAGTYSASYEISSTDPLGTWTIHISASSGGQSASAQLSVSISDALVVTFTSPLGLTTFNVGEAAIIKSLVTYQDGTAVPGSASVTFTTPSGATQVMGVDSTDSSGKTWTGSHVITSADVPSQGIAWPITVSANVGGDSGTAMRQVTLYSSLFVAVSTYSTSSYTTPEATFSPGQTVFVKAAVALHDATVVTSGTVTFEISGTSVAATPVAMTFSTSLSAWTGSYTILSADSQGLQTVTVSAADGHGNAGSGSQAIAIEPSSQGLAVSITSPAPSSVFNRGETATITASVTEGGAPVSGAAVTATTPTGATITLTNTAGGTYSGSYVIASSDPVGTWTILVEAVDGGHLGASQEAVTVSSSLKVAVSTFDSATFTTPKSSFDSGQTAYVKAQVTLQDGTAVTTGTVTFVLTGSSIASTPVTMTFNPSLNAWTGSYTVLQSDQTGNQVITATASDAHGSSGSGTQTIGINAPITTTGLEAAITFNPATHDIVVTAVCGSGCVAPTSVTMTTSSAGQGHGQDLNSNGNGNGKGNGDGNGKGHGNGGDKDDHGSGPAQVRIYTISDSAGHTMTLNVSVKDDGHEVKAHVLGIEYGSGPIMRPAHGRLDFQYSLAKDGSIQTLQQLARSNGTLGVAHYSAAKGSTTIAIGSGERSDKDNVSVTQTGLWTLELVTSQGSLSVSYAQSS